MPDLPKLTDERPLRVAIYLNDLSGGGVERMKLQLIPALRRCGADVELILHATKGELGAIVPRGIKVTAFETSRVLSDILPMARYLRHARPDVLLSSLNHNNLVACLAGLLSGSGVRVFITQHNALSMEAAPGESWKYALCRWPTGWSHRLRPASSPSRAGWRRIWPGSPAFPLKRLRQSITRW